MPPPSGDEPRDEPQGDPARDETPEEQADRNFDDLLQELRVSQTGVQFLFAFLLILAFQNRFADIDAFVRTAYVATVLSTTAAATLLIAPVPVHRALHGHRRKPEVVRVSSRYAQAGLVFLGLSMVGALLLALDATLPRPWAITLAIGVALAVGTAWLLHPMRLAREAGDPVRSGPGHSARRRRRD